MIRRWTIARINRSTICLLIPCLEDGDEKSKGNKLEKARTVVMNEWLLSWIFSLVFSPLPSSWESSEMKASFNPTPPTQFLEFLLRVLVSYALKVKNWSFVSHLFSRSISLSLEQSLRQQLYASSITHVLHFHLGFWFNWEKDWGTNVMNLHDYAVKGLSPLTMTWNFKL